jgi:hypothetical protein
MKLFYFLIVFNRANDRYSGRAKPKMLYCIASM